MNQIISDYCQKNKGLRKRNTSLVLIKMLHRSWVVLAFIATTFCVSGSILPVSDYLFVVIIKKKNNVLKLPEIVPEALVYVERFLVYNRG